MGIQQGLVGVQNNSDSSTPITQQFDQQGAGLVTELHARYYQQTVRGKMFSVSTQAIATTSVGLATAYTGLCVANLITSSVNLVLNKVSMMQSVIQATQVEAFAIATGFNSTTNVTLTVAATPQSTMIGSGGVPVAKAATSATLPTAPLYNTFITNTGTIAADSTGIQVVDLEGSIILPPGGYACWVTPAQASVAGMWFSFCWEEVPVIR